MKMRLYHSTWPRRHGVRLQFPALSSPTAITPAFCVAIASPVEILRTFVSRLLPFSQLAAGRISSVAASGRKARGLANTACFLYSLAALFIWVPAVPGGAIINGDFDSPPAGKPAGFPWQVGPPP